MQKEKEFHINIKINYFNKILHLLLKRKLVNLIFHYKVKVIKILNYITESLS